MARIGWLRISTYTNADRDLYQMNLHEGQEILSQLLQRVCRPAGRSNSALPTRFELHLRSACRTFAGIVNPYHRRWKSTEESVGLVPVGYPHEQYVHNHGAPPDLQSTPTPFPDRWIQTAFVFCFEKSLDSYFPCIYCILIAVVF